ncbi:MAG: ABC transporter permease [Deltaproteobacteria bacterium]|nr:ABC transporter permease [Deltaproteobacteria bacterium]
MERSLSSKSLGAVDSIGRGMSGRLRYYLDLSTLLYLAFKEAVAERQRGFSLVWEITLRQIYFTGVQALKVVTLVSLALGAIIIVQAGSQLALLGGVKFISTILVLVIIRELGPLLTAFIVIGRSGTAIATEIGNMIVAHELEAIRAMGINPVYFIVTPRIIGVTIAVICLTIYFNGVSLLGGFIVSMWILPMDLTVFLEELMISLTATDLIFGILKSAAFGLLIALTCTYHGLTVRYSSIEVPQVATRGVVSAILSCFTFNVLLTVLFYL